MNAIKESSSHNMNEEDKHLGKLAMSEIMPDEDEKSFENKYRDPVNGPYFCFVLGYN